MLLTSSSGHQQTFHYLNQGHSPHIDGVDDAADFQETRRAFTLLGINDAAQEQIFRILAGILHLGNVTLEEGNGDSSTIDVSCFVLHCSYYNLQYMISKLFDNMI